MSALKQAVILCGGLGSRLRPLTDIIPKPLAPINGRPFLFFLISQLRDQGIKKFLLLTGYRGDMIREYFGNGDKLSVQIDYSQGPSSWETGRRLWEARALLDPEFLLLYSDNFVQFNLRKLSDFHLKKGTSITVTLAPKKNGNVRISPNGIVEVYDKDRLGDKLDYVEVGYMIVDRHALLIASKECIGFPDTSLSIVLENLAREQKLGGLIVRDPYQSISDIDRLNLTREYLRPKRILLIDRDGTINKKMPKGEYVISWESFYWIPETLQAMKALAKRGFEFIVITNQAGIALGALKQDDLDQIHRKMTAVLNSEGIVVRKIYVSPDHWGSDSYSRKPSPGLFFSAAGEFNLRMDRCLYVGDDERDVVAAFNAGCGMVYLSDSSTYLPLDRLPSPFLRSRSLLECVEDVVNIYRDWELDA